MRNPRPLVWILGGVAVAGVLVWLARAPGASDRAAPPQSHAPHAQPGQAPAAQREPAPALPPGPASGSEHLDHHDDLEAGELAGPPAALPEPPAEDEVTTRPEQQPPTPEDQRARRQASIELLDRNIERLETEQKAAEASGDTRTAERNRIRVARMRQRRAALAAEPADLDDASP